MPKVKKVDEVAVLSEQLIEVLGQRRALGPSDYPPTLSRLATLSGLSPDDDRVLKAVSKKVFTDRATAKATGKVSLESPVYFKEDVPSKAELARRELAELAGRMLRVLESQRDLGGDAYPPTLGRLAELCGLRSSNPIAPRAAALEIMTAEVTFANTGKPATDSPVILKRDLETDHERANTTLLAFAFGRSRKENVKTAFTANELSTKLQKPLQTQFKSMLKALIERKGLPPEFAWLPNKDPLIFLRDDIKPAHAVRAEAPVNPHISTAVAEVPVGEFAPAFREAFVRIDRRNGLSNNVKLLDLRRELAGFDRSQFDAGLRQLRVDREFSLDSHEGLLRPLTAEEREAGIAEAGSLLVYVSRR